MDHLHAAVQHRDVATAWTNLFSAHPLNRKWRRYIVKNALHRRTLKTTAAKVSTEILSNRDQGDSEWLQTPTGERLKIRTSAEDTPGADTMLEMVADPRIGVPMHIHKSEDEHFIVLEGTLHIVNGNKNLDAAAESATHG